MYDAPESDYSLEKSEQRDDENTHVVVVKKDNPLKGNYNVNENGVLSNDTASSQRKGRGVRQLRNVGNGVHGKGDQKAQRKALGCLELGRKKSLRSESKTARQDKSRKDCLRNSMKDSHLCGSGSFAPVDSKRKVTGKVDRSTNKRNRKVQPRGLDRRLPSTDRVLRSSYALRCYEVKSDSEASGDAGIDEENEKSSTYEDRMETVRNEKERKKLIKNNEKVLASPGVSQKDAERIENEETRIDVFMRSKTAGLNASQDIGGPSGRVLRKRGRPPKVKGMNISEDMREQALEMRPLKRLRGRPRKIKETDGSESNRRFFSKMNPMKRKRGRPPKLHANHQWDNGNGGGNNLQGESLKLLGFQQSDGNIRVYGRKLKRKRGRPPKEKNGNQSTYNMEDQRDLESDGWMKNKMKYSRKKPSISFESDEAKIKEQENSDHCPGSSILCTRNQSDEKQSKSIEKVESNLVKTGEHSRQAAKKLLRDRIVGLLLAAGWKVEYRPRKGREYCDAVYVNPRGKTHWSVTLAYRVYKAQCEKGDSQLPNNGFSSELLQEDELSILKRETQNPRNDKGKRRIKDKNGETVEESTCVKRENKKKSNKVKSAHKSKLKRAENSHGNKCREKPKRGKLSWKQNGLDCSRQQTQAKRRCTLLARNSLEGAVPGNDGFILYDGKRTLLSWMIDVGTVSLNEKVQLMNSRKSQALFEGQIRREGIFCKCCNKVISIPDFDIHSGCKLNEPAGFQNLYRENGHSLLHCLLKTWNSQDESKLRGFHHVDINSGDPNDDTCGICGDGGDLICCDGCPSTFHQSCLDIEKFPAGDWFCVHCSCKYCGLIDESGNQMHDTDAAVSSLLTCQSCEEKYHKSCIHDEEASYDDQNGLLFCGRNCQMLFERMQRLLGVKQKLEGGFSWTLLHRHDISPDVSPSDVSQKIECNCKLAVAFSIMDECFSPLVDHRSGANLLQNIVYNIGSNFSRLNYRGFLTAVLERGDEVIAAASIRIHGNQLAEMPFIGTRYMYRRQGMCRRLMSGIESALCFLNVEKLVIPAVPELTETWTSIFDFKALEESGKQKIRDLNMLVFPRVDMLQKPMLRNNASEELSIPSNGLNSEQAVYRNRDDKDKSAHDGTSTGLDSDIKFQAIKPVLCDKNNGVVDSESHSKDIDDCAKSIICVTKENVNPLGSVCDSKHRVQLGVAEETENGVSSSDHNPQGPDFEATKQSTEIRECHSTIAVAPNKKPLENLVSDPPFDRLRVTAT